MRCAVNKLDGFGSVNEGVELHRRVSVEEVFAAATHQHLGAALHGAVAVAGVHHMQVDAPLVQAIVDEEVLVLAEDAAGGVAVQHLDAPLVDKLIDGLPLGLLSRGERVAVARGQHGCYQQGHAHENL